MTALASTVHKFSVQALRPYGAGTTVAASELVKNIITATPNPLSTREIYRLATKGSSFKAAPAKAALAPGPRKTSTTPKLPSYLALKPGRKPPPAPPLPDHPIRSITYLKEVVLPSLVATKQIQKFHTQRTLSEDEMKRRLASMSKAKRREVGDTLHVTPTNAWLWRLVPPVGKPRPKPVAKKVFGAEVGRGVDWGHLNKRRRRSRIGKVSRDFAKMRTIVKLAREIQTAEFTASAPERAARKAEKDADAIAKFGVLPGRRRPKVEVEATAPKDVTSKSRTGRKATKA